MNDYLDMIKNPNRKASTSPAPDPSNTSRSSAPFPNPVSLPSENLHYVNNLDRIKSIDLKTWGTKEETPLSRGLRSGYESPFDQIGRDPAPRHNRFSAPITSIGERAITPTQSLFGDIPAPQPQNLLGAYKSSFVDLSSGGVDKYRDRSPRPMTLGNTLDTSPSGGVFGNSSGSSASNRTSSKIGSGSITSNTGLFRDSSYKGSGQDSITQRKSMMSTQPSSTFSNTFRFGDVSRFSRDTSPLFDSQEKSPMLKKKQKKKVDAAIFILQALVVILVVVAVKVVFMTEHVVFCDNPDIGRPMIPGCVPCPQYGTCNYGRLVRCDDKYKEYKDECVLDYETTAKFAQYRSYINDRLAYYKGEKLCNNTIKDYLTLEEIRSELLAKYGNKDSGRLNYDFKIQWEEYFETEEGLVQETRGDIDIYTTVDEGSPSLSCKCKLIWREGKLVGIWLVLFVATIVLTVKLVRLHLIYSRLGKEMYEDVREYLSHFKNVSVKTLKKEFEHKHPGKNFEKIWSYVENYRKEDARIYQYFDIFQGVNQEFWLRVR